MKELLIAAAHKADYLMLKCFGKMLIRSKGIRKVYFSIDDVFNMVEDEHASMRDRMTDDGEHWLQPRMREFISGKLKDNNEQHTENEKKKINRVPEYIFSFGGAK